MPALAPGTNLDLRVLPHLDLHMAISPGSPTLKLDVIRISESNAGATTFTVDSARAINPKIKDKFDFFAPHNAKGKRLDNLPTVTNGVVSATTPGVYLFQVTVAAANNDRIGSIVGRLQVHNKIEDWWFGNDSITTALDPAIGHSQPTIYAKFSDDQTGADLIGDITGHNYVQLTSTDPSKVVVGSGRLRGVTEMATTVTLNGTFLSRTRSLEVRVVDYAKVRRELRPVRFSDLAHADQKSNLVFIAEGFRQEDEGAFLEIVRYAKQELFEKLRHQPYGLLEKSFYVFEIFSPSQQQTLTCGFRVTDTRGPFNVTGIPIPTTRVFEGAGQGTYSLVELIERVGLPKQGEDRNLKNVWPQQNLRDFQLSKVDDKLIEAWKAHRSAGILQASDTMFGMIIGRRWADRSRVPPVGEPAAAIPAKDEDSDTALPAFIDRLYDFYRVPATVEVTLDPRRHPPELYANQHVTNPNNTIIKYLAGLQYFRAPNYPIGRTWIPDDTKSTLSRGLVAVVVNDSLIGGTSINNGSMTATTVNRKGNILFTVTGAGLMRRDQPPTPNAGNLATLVNFDHFVDTVAHELAHNYSLGDEYEDRGSSVDPPGATDLGDLDFDNVSRIGFLRLGVAPASTLDRCVKGKTLPQPNRMRMSCATLRVLATTARVQRCPTMSSNTVDNRQ
jgi:hypothetical protein